MEPSLASRHARTAVAVTCGLYVGYGLLSWIPGGGAVAGTLLIAGFYFLPGWLLRDDPALASEYQVGPDVPIPAWSWRGLRVALAAMAVVFPVFVLCFVWFYSRVCEGDLRSVSPWIWIESRTPWSGQLTHFLSGLCRRYGGDFWPDTVRLPLSWREYGGLGWLKVLVEGVFAVALPEEIFHRGYLMSALEKRWPPKRVILGAPLGWAAVLSSLLFAVGHLVGMAETARLATFFPALVFAWLWRRSGSLWAPVIFHAASNMLMDLLLASTFPFS